MVNGQHFSGTGYQLDGTENRDPILGIIVINPNLESIGETRSRRRTTTPSSARRPRASSRCRPSRARTSSTAAPSSSTRATGSRRATRSRSRTPEPAHRASPARDEARPVRRIARRPDPEEQDRSSSATTRARAARVGGSQAADGARPTRARTRRPERVRRQHLRPAERRRPRSGTQFPGNVIPASRLSPQALAHPGADSAAEPPGRNGTRDNYVAQGSETFDSDAFNVRIDGRLSDRLNTFGRYSFGRLHATVRRRSAQGGGRGVGDLGGVSKVKQPEPGDRAATTRFSHDSCWTSASAASGTGWTCCRSTSAPRRRPTPASPA